VTEAQLRLFREFDKLPIYDESEEKATTVATAAGAGCPTVHECCTIREVEECLKNPRLVPLGALRAGSVGRQVVVAYFGESPA
jgi:hypothetical protein